MSHLIVSSATGSGQTGITSGSNLVTQIARIVGGEGEPEIRNQALDALNRVRIELNNHDWRFMKTTDDPITLADGTATYTLERTFRKPSYAMLIDAAGDQKFNLDYLDDETSARIPYDRAATGQPTCYFLRNDFEDGLVTLVPIPDSNTATNYRLSVEYYARIEAFADTTDPVSLPEELVNPLVIGGQAYMLRERDKQSPATVQAFADYQRVKMLLLSEDRRFTDEQPRFRIKQRQTAPFGTVYIKA